MDDKQIEVILVSMENTSPGDGQLVRILRNLLGRIRDLEQSNAENQPEHDEAPEAEPPHDNNDLD